MSDFGHAKEDLLREYRDLKHEIPSHDTFSRVFRLIEPKSFAETFGKFTAPFSQALPNDIIVLDGKAVKSAFDRGKCFIPPMIINAWATQSRMVLSQYLFEDSNETAAAIKLVGMLDIAGAIVTTDALHCNRKFETAVLEQGANYTLALKGNQFLVTLPIIQV